MDAAKKAALEAARKDRLAWIELGAAQEREELLDLLPTVGNVAQVRELLLERQRASGVQVHRCRAEDMEVNGEQT